MKMQFHQQGAEFYCDGLINLTERRLKDVYNKSDYVDTCIRVQKKNKEKHLFLIQRKFLTVTRRKPRGITFQHVLVKIHLKKEMDFRVLPRTTSLVDISYTRMENIYLCFMA